jgi:rod shape-determining protein MreC
LARVELARIEAVDERRTGWLLGLLLVGQLIFLALEGARGASDTLIESWGLHLLGPAARAIAAVPASVSGMREGLRMRGRLQEDNRKLRREVEELRLRLLQLTDVEQEMQRLGDAVHYPAPPAGRIRALDIIYADHVSWLRTLLVYTGGQPVRVSQPVLSPAGLVGRVITVAGSYAKVQIITDRAASVGAMVLRTRRQGVVRGSGQGEGLLLDYVPLQADVRPGDQVVTAGIDGVYPRGIPIGTVVAVSQGGQLFHHIEVAPAVDFGTLDQVYLLDYTPPPPSLREAQPGVRP